MHKLSSTKAITGPLSVICLLIFLGCLFPGPGLAQTIEISERNPLVLGEVLQFQSNVLKEQRTLNIYLPPYYQQDTARHYPVLYLLDGAMDEDFVHIVGLVQFATFPWVKMMPETIVVGIANTDRKRDFSYPTGNEKDKKEFPTSGGSANFTKFIEQELQPLINDTYRTNDQRIILGQSFGGLLATEILLKKPSLFDHYLIVSPSLWWDDESLLTESASIEDETKIFIAVGKEGEVMERTAKSLVAKISEMENSKVKTFFHFLGTHDHANILHLAAYKGLELLFAAKK